MRILSGFIRETLVPREKYVVTKTQRVWRKPFLFAAGILFIAAVVTFILSSYSWGVPAAIFGAALLCIILASKISTWEDTTALDAAIRAAHEKWKNETGEDSGKRYEDILAALDRAAEKSRASAQNYERAATRLAELEKEKAVRAMQKKQAGDAETAAGRQLRNLLDDTGVTSITDYAAILGKKENTAAQYKELDEKLKSALAENGASSFTELENILVRKMAENHEKITETEIPVNELNLKKNLLKEIKVRLEELQREEKEKIGGYNMDLGKVRGQLRGLPEKIADCEKKILEKNNRLLEISKQLRAAKIAKELYASISENSNLVLDQLSREIGEMFSAMISTERTVNMKSFSSDSTSIIDAQGIDRDSGLLSTGTRDAFLLAARLVLARKSVDANNYAIIVLDEPFLALDRPRIGFALTVLEEFYKATYWQIILFTKDKETVKQAHSVFGKKLCVHTLSPFDE